MTDQQTNLPSTGVGSETFSTVKLHPQSLRVLTDCQRTLHTRVYADEDHPVHVSVIHDNIADANSLVTNYDWITGVQFKYGGNVALTWAAYVDFTQKTKDHINHPLQLIENVRLQSLDLVSCLPELDPNQIYGLAIYSINIGPNPTFVLDTSKAPPTYWIPLVSNSTAPTATNILSPDPLGASVTLRGLQTIFVIGGPYSTDAFTVPGNGTPIVPVPIPLAPEPINQGAVLSMRIVKTYKQGRYESNLPSAKRKYLMD